MNARAAGRFAWSAGRVELERAIAFFREAGATASLEQAKELLFALT